MSYFYDIHVRSYTLLNLPFVYVTSPGKYKNFRKIMGSLYELKSQE